MRVRSGGIGPVLLGLLRMPLFIPLSPCCVSLLVVSQPPSQSLYALRGSPRSSGFGISSPSLLPSASETVGSGRGAPRVQRTDKEEGRGEGENPLKRGLGEDTVGQRRRHT